MPFIDVENTQMCYEERGSGIPFLIIPGFGLDNHATIATFEPIFEGKGGWWRIYPDMPGTGNTPLTSSITTADDWLKSLSIFVAKLIGDSQFAIAGISYGAYLARGVLFRYFKQVLGIFLGVPVIIPDRQSRVLPKFQLIEKDPVFIASLPQDERKEFEEMATIQTLSVWDRYKKTIIPSMQHSNWDYLNKLQSTHYAFSFDLDAELPPFNSPSLILTGRQDNVCGYRDAWAIIEKFPRASFVVLDRASHCLDLEQVPLSNALISEWLDRVRLTVKNDSYSADVKKST
ncbi:MAG: hydrolase [Promethearchaeota archaeon CR_4]|nr:MAG: hydrolase [Candidatus Lokiarchaeota archaeon CR_4]